jgi:hypothetical protein
MAAVTCTVALGGPGLRETPCCGRRSKRVSATCCGSRWGSGSANNDNHHHNNEHAGPAPVTISAPHKNNLQQDGSSADGCQQQQAQAQRLAQQ